MTKKTARIPLSRGMYATIDAEDLKRVNQFTWHASPHGNTFYACSSKPEVRRLHRFVMGLSPHDGTVVDHLNGNGLDCRKAANLRLVTLSTNTQKQPHRRLGISGFKGVTKYYDRWTARIRVPTASGKRGHQLHIGCFDTAEEAAEAFDERVLAYYGPAGVTNKSLGLLP